jgi:type II secretory pathway component GspD/PulD (secretin)
VRKNYFEEIGFDWAHGTNGQMLTSTSASGYTRQNDNGQINASINNTKGPSASISDYNPSGKGLLLDVSHSPFSFLNRDQVNLVLNAVENEGDITTLEQPQLTCYNGQRAHAAFLRQLAYIADYEIVSSNYDPRITVLAYGNSIDIRPVVSSDRKYVTMEVRPSSVSRDGVFIDYITATRTIGGNGNGNNNNNGGIVSSARYPIEMPNLSVHSLRSTVMIPDKASLLIGGFQKSGRETTSTGVPFLSNIPFLGRLFSRNGTYDLDDRTFYLLHTEIIDMAEKEAVQ